MKSELIGGLDFPGSCNGSRIESGEESLKYDGSSETQYGSAVWDIFRRQDVPKLMEYLRKHHKEFRHINNLPVPSVCSLPYCCVLFVGL